MFDGCSPLLCLSHAPRALRPNRWLTLALCAAMCGTACGGQSSSTIGEPAGDPGGGTSGATTWVRYARSGLDDAFDPSSGSVLCAGAATDAPSAECHVLLGVDACETCAATGAQPVGDELSRFASSVERGHGTSACWCEAPALPEPTCDTSLPEPDPSGWCWWPNYPHCWDPAEPLALVFGRHFGADRLAAAHVQGDVSIVAACLAR